MPQQISSRYITGTLIFSLKKILLTTGEESYFVRLPRGKHGYLHGDRVRARITRSQNDTQMAEVEIISLESRTREILLARVISKKGKKGIQVLKECGNYESDILNTTIQSIDGDIVLMRFTQDGRPQILRKFMDASAFDAEEQILFFLAQIRLNFPSTVLSEAESVRNEGQYFFDQKNISKKTTIRRDFRDLFVFTIDGVDAKDLDDAISIERDIDGNYLLGVHIADVAEYIREGSHLDREALDRATSVYTPGKVIPMLPEPLSNDVCSLHPGAPKLTLSCLMTIDPNGMVKKTEMVEGIIESAHRWVYEDIEEKHRNNNPVLDDTVDRISSYKHSPQSLQTLSEAIALSYELYHILDRRRAREGKILFETTEMYFEFDEEGTSLQQQTVLQAWDNLAQKIVPSHIHKRERVEAHKLIEEFMVLANEEVAKWCDHRGIPFLSRIHGLPPQGAIAAIHEILRGDIVGVKQQSRFGVQKARNLDALEPIDIRRFLDRLSGDALYRYSRLLLPKMAKAVYADRKYRHFGLALEYYAHFTSPIRRYGDLQIHRIIKEELHGTLTPSRREHFWKILRRVARHCSERERNAEDIERAFDALYACRYMVDKIGRVFSGRVSWIAEFAYFVELENAVEVTVYLPHSRRYITDPLTGYLTNQYGKKMVQIGDTLDVKILDVLFSERRIVAERSGLSFWQSPSFS